MALTTRNFRIGLYLEHLEEAAFLYEQCHALRAKPDFRWRQLDEFEARCEAHLDALVIGGALALEVCMQRASEGEPGELFAAVTVFCRSQRAAEFSRTLHGLGDATPAQHQAIADALKNELPAAWGERCAAALAQPDPALAPILLAVIAHRRLPFAARIVTANLVDHPASCAAAARTLGRLRDPGGLPALAAYARRPEPEVRREVLAAMLALGSREALPPAHQLALSEAWAQPVLAVAGGASACETLLKSIERAPATRETAWALGLLGDLRGVRALLSLLDGKLAVDAAWGLYLITGAPLFGEVFVTEPVAEDELSESELHAWRSHGTAPLRGDGRPFGSEQTMLSVDPAAWNEWLSANAGRFEAGKRYRLGLPASPATLLQTLQQERLPDALRQATADEIRIRYDCDLPFESAMPVRQQLRILRGLARWVEQHHSHFIAGQWYLAAQPVE